ncbi:UDP-xylose and UDP-N-acetylglucosamine transporter [Eurytemora carolleeae]|uniref:UDP-xylose and UDP-N-acetylglucosamine transporter n=1 Tax=Eurytemora carolleeae TaxID=1294199 RepID=UPI000C791D0B|nr:UDP-xylose and UDP-N-acetylglucosamine transporter [Eurytemora carolleeae]|eukprot:XP_023333120.1 UDP-xylose and UDP-N-acetylglucosamine transporter-like [Eurytemora affinis]
MIGKAELAVIMVLLGCCSNVVFLELLIQEAPGIGNLVTFTQFLIIAIEGFVFTMKWGTVPLKVPFNAWFTLVIMYFLVSVTNNYALNFNIPMPLHMIFRAGSLLANMIMGFVLLGKRYTWSKYSSVLMISLGIGTCTIMSTQNNKTNISEGDDWDNWWLTIGISLLTFALFMSARMGIYQEVIYAKHGKHPKEAMFFLHALPLPGFLLLAPDIYKHAAITINSTPFILPFINIQMPSMLLYLIGNIITQYLCISAVFVLTTECASLTVTLVVTLRKFLSLLFSIWYFQNPFTTLHWVGTGLVFGGTILFSGNHLYFL